jgi:hypothetical protein
VRLPQEAAVRLVLLESSARWLLITSSVPTARDGASAVLVPTGGAGEDVVVEVISGADCNSHPVPDMRGT